MGFLLTTACVPMGHWRCRFDCLIVCSALLAELFFYRRDILCDKLAMMSVTLFNTLTRKEEEITQSTPQSVGVYSCGPTVYFTASIGNFRSFLFADTLVRTLRYNDIEVKWVMNITDVGHLVGDGDEGEDKLQMSAKKQGKTAWDIAEAYTAEFFQDMDRLNIIRPDVLPKATDHIPEQIRMVEELEKNGHTYRTSDGIYFDTSTYKDYSVMSGQSTEDKQAGARVEVNQEKRNPADFALWKFSPTDEQRDMEWESPWGVGFPGWHIECSAMSMKYLGDLYDIHTGGADHKTVHHPNEIAQAYGSRGTQEAKVWMHNEFLQVDGGRMGKSLGNAYSISELIERGFDPLAYRYFTFQAHYRRQLNFTFEALEAAQNALKKIRLTVRQWDLPAIGSPEYEERFLNAINDDLDMPQAIAIIWDMINDNFVASSAKAQSLKRFDAVLGLDLMQYIATPLKVPEDVEKIMNEREVARAKKDFDKSDELRDKIKSLGYLVEDTIDGQQISEL